MRRFAALGVSGGEGVASRTVGSLFGLAFGLDFATANSGVRLFVLGGGGGGDSDAVTDSVSVSYSDSSLGSVGGPGGGSGGETGGGVSMTAGATGAIGAAGATGSAGIFTLFFAPGGRPLPLFGATSETTSTSGTVGAGIISPAGIKSIAIFLLTE